MIRIFFFYIHTVSLLMKRPFQLQGEASPGEPTGITTEKTALSLPSPVCEFMEFSLKRIV